MPKTKQRLSKLRNETRALFSWESTIQKSVTAVSLAAFLAVLYLAFPFSNEKTQPVPHHFIILVFLSVFLAVNLIQQGILMRIRRKWSQLEEQSTHDGLTGAFNREAFEGILDEEMSRAKRYHFPLSLCIVDLDNFKMFNDRYGHPQGDRLLKEFVARVQKAIRSADCIARYGGDEFFILLPHTDLTSAERFLTRMLFEVQEWLDFTFSAGVTSYRPAEDKLALITRADMALYQAKREGKNQIRCLIGNTDDQVVLKS